jgi:hypothetical protein
MVSAWYPPEYQGLAMGIAGAGNSGTLGGDAVRATRGEGVRVAQRIRCRHDSGLLGLDIVLRHGEGRAGEANREALERLRRDP